MIRGASKRVKNRKPDGDFVGLPETLAALYLVPFYLPSMDCFSS